jgi:hypothetical protein
VVQHIGSEGTLPEATPLVRQNPGPLSQKVSNHAEMYEALGRDAEDDAPSPDAGLPALPDILGPPGGLHAYAPIDGPGFGPGVMFLAWLDRAASSGAGLPGGQILDAAIRGDLFPRLPREDLASRVVFTIVCDPLQRAYALMLDEMFGPGWKQAPIRRAVIETVGPLPDGRGALKDPAAFPPELARATLDAFLDIVETALSGSGDFIAPAAWHSQAAQIEAFKTRTAIARVVAMPSLPTFLRRQSIRVGAPVPASQEIAKMLTAGHIKAPAVSDVADAAIRARVRRLYADDYATLGEMLGLEPDGDGPVCQPSSGPSA